jgi:enoyl-CoA hydratase/carnithine racemase
MGLEWSLARIVGGARARELLFFPEKLTGARALELGLVAEVVPAGDLMAAARRWAAEMLECSPASIRATKAVIQSYVNEGLEASNKGMFNLPEVRSLLSGPDAREGPKAFAEKRKPSWANPS